MLSRTANAGSLPARTLVAAASVTATGLVVNRAPGNVASTAPTNAL